MPFFGCPNKIIVADFQGLPQLLEIVGDVIDKLLLAFAGELGVRLDFLAVLIGAS
jgi:hypothetical protein